MFSTSTAELQRPRATSVSDQRSIPGTRRTHSIWGSALVLAASLGLGATASTVGAATASTPIASATTLTPQPLGPRGTWTLTFGDEFEGTRLDTTKWSPNWYGEGGKMNNVGTHAANVSVMNGKLRLQLDNPDGIVRGALIHTDYKTGRYLFPVGSVIEARVYFPGSSTQQFYNWPAWWVSGPDWPNAGEHDIAEGLGGDPTVNYHSPSGSHNQGTVSGVWNNAFHVYTLHRKASRADVYWDGQLVRSYATDDNGKPEDVILNIGRSNSRTPVLGAAGAVRVDYVRAWRPS